MAGSKFEERIQWLISLLGQIAAFLTLAVYLCLIINANWAFIPEGEILNTLNILKIYAPLMVVMITALEFAETKGFLIKLIVVAAIAVVVIFQFFPGTWENFIGIVGGTQN